MDLHKELLELLNSLNEYRTLLNREDEESQDNSFVGVPIPQGSKSQEEIIEELRGKLLRSYGRLGQRITELTGKSVLEKWGRVYEIWSTGLTANPSAPINYEALSACIDVTNLTIGALEIEGESWGVNTVTAARTSENSPTAFIAHEGMTKALDKVTSLLDTLGIKYVIAEIEPSDGRSVEKQVQWTQGKANFAIILATKGKVVDKETGKHYMGMNVADELGRAREIYKNRIILLLQKGIEPHTNVSEIIYEPFATRNMENVFKKIIKEIRNWGLLD